MLAFLIEAQLSKQQILELYLNRIFLGAGIYGVEAMSQRVFGKPAKDLTLAESALIAGLARAPAALSPWSNLDEAIARSHVVLARMRDEGFITERRSAAHAARRSACGRIAARASRRHGYAKAYLRQRFRDEFGGDHPPDWRVDTTFVAALQDAAEAAVEKGLQAHRQAGAAGGAGRHRSGDRQRAGAGRRPRLSAIGVQSRQPQPASARLGLQAVRVCRGARARHVAGVDADRPQSDRAAGPRRVDAAQRARRCAGRADAAGGADRIEQSRRHAAAAAGRHRPRACASRHDAGLDDLPDVPSLALGTGLVTPLAITAAFSVFPNGGLAVRPRDIIARARRRRRHRVRSSASRPSA